MSDQCARIHVHSSGWSRIQAATSGCSLIQVDSAGTVAWRVDDPPVVANAIVTPKPARIATTRPPISHRRSAGRPGRADGSVVVSDIGTLLISFTDPVISPSPHQPSDPHRPGPLIPPSWFWHRCVPSQKLVLQVTAARSGPGIITPCLRGGSILSARMTTPLSSRIRPPIRPPMRPGGSEAFPGLRSSFVFAWRCHPRLTTEMTTLPAWEAHWASSLLNSPINACRSPTVQAVARRREGASGFDCDEVLDGKEPRGSPAVAYSVRPIPTDVLRREDWVAQERGLTHDLGMNHVSPLFRVSTPASAAHSQSAGPWRRWVSGDSEQVFPLELRRRVERLDDDFR